MWDRILCDLSHSSSDTSRKHLLMICVMFLYVQQTAFVCISVYAKDTGPLALTGK